MTVIEHTDDNGNRAVFYDGRLSVYGKPSMTADDGTVAVGVDWPDAPLAQGAVSRVEEIAAAMERAADLAERDPLRPVTRFDAREWAEALREIGGQSNEPASPRKDQS